MWALMSKEGRALPPRENGCAVHSGINIQLSGSVNNTALRTLTPSIEVLQLALPEASAAAAEHTTLASDCGLLLLDDHA